MSWAHLPSLAAVTALLAASPAALQGASFDCGKATSRVDRIICSSDTLSHLDESLAEEYRSALARSADAGRIKSEQRAWIKSRNGCADAACFEQAYRSRLDALRPVPPRASPAPALEGATRPYQPYPGEGDAAVSQNENGEQLYVTAATILGYDHDRLFTSKGDFFWAPSMPARRVDAMSSMAEGLQGRQARITYSKMPGKSERTECMVEGLARSVSLFDRSTR